MFCLFKTCSLLLFLVGLLDFAAGIAACVLAKTFSSCNGTFIFLGVVLVLLAVFAFKTRYSSRKITCYLVLLSPCMLAQLSFTIGIFAYTDYADEVDGQANAYVFEYVLLGACAVVLVCYVLGCCYRSSLRSAQFYRNLERDHPLMSREKKKDDGPSHHDRIKGDLAS